MPIFDEILKPEEQLGRFNPGEPDDDTFILEAKGTYPGSAPVFEDQKQVFSQEISMAPLYEAPEEGSVWDVFDSAQPEVLETAPIDSDFPIDKERIDPDALEAELHDKIANLDNLVLEDEEDLFSAPTEQPEEDLFGSAINFDLDNPQETANIIQEPFIEQFEEPQPSNQQELSPISQDEFQIDEDLKAMLQADLAEKKSKKEEADSLLSSEEKAKNETFVPVDDLEDAVVIDFASISPDLDAEEAKAEPQPEPVKDEQKPKTKKAKPVKEKKPKKKRYILMPFAYAAMITLSLSILGAGGYYAWYKFIIEEKPKEEIVEEHKPEEKKVETHAKAEEPKHDTAEAKTEEKHDSDLVQKPETKPAEELKEAPKAEPKKEIEKPKKEIPAKKELPAAKEKPIKEAKKDIAVKTSEKPKEPVEKAKPAKKEQPKPKVEKPEPKPLVTKHETKPTKETSKSIKKEEVYTVQIYSSPSKEDAEAWLDKLRKRNISGGFISPQKVRDQVWYRVRFGNFASRDEASAAAKRHGFAQSWVDRIK